MNCINDQLFIDLWAGDNLTEKMSGNGGLLPDFRHKSVSRSTFQHFHANYIEMIHQTTRWPPVSQETYGNTVAGLNIQRVHDNSVIKRFLEVLENLQIYRMKSDSLFVRNISHKAVGGV